MLKIKSLIFFLIFSLFLYSCLSKPDGDKHLKDDEGNEGNEKIIIPVLKYDLWSSTAQLPIISWISPATADHHALIALETTDTDDKVDFKNTTSTNSHTFTLTSPVTCAQYFPQVKFINETNTSDSRILANEKGITYAPSTPSELTGLILTVATSYDTPEISWTKPNIDCGFSHYSVAVKTASASANDVLDWIKIPNTMDETKYQFINGIDGVSINLNNGTNYQVLIRTVHLTDAISPTATSSVFSKPSKFESAGSNKYFWNLDFWLDSADASTMFSNSSCTGTPIALSSTEQDVACWKGKSSNAFKFTGASGKRPSVSNVSAGLNFDGASGGDILKSSFQPTVNSVLEFFVVTKPRKQTKNGSYARPLIAWVGDSTFKPWIYIENDHDTRPSANAIHVGTSGITSLNIGTTYLLSASHDGATKKWNGYIFGELKSTNNLPTSYESSTELNVGGEMSNSSRRYRGNILEVIAYDKILSEGNRQKVEGYLACKWDFRDKLQSSHPYYNSDSTSNTGCF